MLCLFLVLACSLSLVGAKPTESQNKTLNAEVTNECLEEARLNTTTPDQCGLFKDCCQRKCPPSKGFQMSSISCHKNDNEKLTDKTQCSCPHDVNAGGFFKKLGLVLVIGIAVMVLAILACIACCYFACCV